MARVTYSIIEVGDDQVTGPNTIFTDIATQTTNLEKVNFGEGGLDERVLEANIHAEQAFTPVATDTVATQALTTTWATLNYGTSMRSGAFSIATNEKLILILRLEFYSDSTQEGILLDTDAQLRWRQSVSSVESTIGRTARLLPTTTGVPQKTGGGDGSLGSPARMAFQVLVDGPVSFDWIEVQISDQSSNNYTVQCGGATLVGTIYKRVTA